MREGSDPRGPYQGMHPPFKQKLEEEADRRSRQQHGQNDFDVVGSRPGVGAFQSTPPDDLGA